MNSRLVDGKKIAEEMLIKLAEEVKKINRPLRLAAILVGHHPAGQKFLELKKAATVKIGLDFRSYNFTGQLLPGALLAEVRKIAADPQNSGVLVELPLPVDFSTELILNAIPPEKDVDVLSERSSGHPLIERAGILAPAARAMQVIFERYGIETRDKTAVVFGQGRLVGKPVANWLYRQGARVSVVDEFTKNPENYSQKADILVSGVGRPGLITGQMVKNGVVAIDFGCENKEGKIAGDFDFDSMVPKCSLITPVPGGVGPLVIAAVLENLVKLASAL